MKAVLCHSYDGIESLKVCDIDSPILDKNTAIVRVHAVAFNFFDTLIIKGLYQYKPEPPFSPGAEIAGIVEDIDENINGIKKGDKVAAYLKWGGCRELVKVEVTKLVKIPDNVSMEVASGVHVTFGTVMHAFRNRANLQKDETVAVLGAAGGIGQAAVEIAKLMGARVIACASSDEKLKIAKQLGADELINYNSENLKEKLKALTNERGVDVVFDPVGGDLAELALRATGWRGRFLVIGFASGEIPKIPLNLALLKGCDIVGVFWGDAMEREPEQNRKNTNLVFDWISKKRIKPMIHATFPLADSHTALIEIAKRRVIGKVVVNPQI